MFLNTNWLVCLIRLSIQTLLLIPLSNHFIANIPRSSLSSLLASPRDGNCFNREKRREEESLPLSHSLHFSLPFISSLSHVLSRKGNSVATFFPLSPSLSRRKNFRRKEFSLLIFPLSPSLSRDGNFAVARSSLSLRLLTMEIASVAWRTPPLSALFPPLEFSLSLSFLSLSLAISLSLSLSLSLSHDGNFRREERFASLMHACVCVCKGEEEEERKRERGRGGRRKVFLSLFLSPPLSTSLFVPPSLPPSPSLSSSSSTTSALSTSSQREKREKREERREKREGHLM